MSNQNVSFKTSRTAYVDIAKGIAILAVVLCHVDFTYPDASFINISAMLEWYCIPVFFIIGGFFLKEERLVKPVSFIKGKMKSLYLLALYIYLPATLLHNVFFDWGWYSADAVYGDKIIAEWGVKEYALGIVKTLLCAGREPIMGAMWFVYALLFALCGYSIITFIVNKCKRGGVLYSCHSTGLANSLMHPHQCIWADHTTGQQCYLRDATALHRATTVWKVAGEV